MTLGTVPIRRVNDFCLSQWQLRLVTPFHRESHEIETGTLASMIRQPGLDKKLFG